MTLRLSKANWVRIGYVILHVLTHLTAGAFEVAPGIHVSIWYPPVGLAFALLVLLGPSEAWLVFLANFATAWLTSTARVPWTAFVFPGYITIVYAGAAWLVRRTVGPVLLPGGRRGTQVFCLAVAVPPLANAIIGNVIIALTRGAGVASSGGLTFNQLYRSVLDWWIGDSAGLLTVVPVVMVFVAPWLFDQSSADYEGHRPGGIGKALLRGATLAATATGVVMIPALREHDAFYLCFLPLVWICAHHGLKGATVATFVVSVVGLAAMHQAGTTAQFAYVYFLFEVAVAGVGLGIGTLVSHRNAAEAKLARSQAQLDRVIEGAHLGMWDWDVRANRVDINDRFAAMIGFSRADLSGLPEKWTTLIRPEDRIHVEGGIAAHLKGMSPLFEAEFRLRSKEGTWTWIHSRGSIVARNAAGEAIVVSGTHVDITDRKRAEAEVIRLTQLIEATPDLILTTDREGRVLYANQAALKLWRSHGTALTPIGSTLSELFPGPAGETLVGVAIPAALRSGAWQGELGLAAAGGPTIPTSQVVLANRDEETDSFLLSFIMRDISDQKRAETERIERERRMLQIQKNESLGVLAGGIAHDFNNLLTAVVGNAALARIELPSESAAQAYIDSVETAATRASALCHQMLAYAGKNPVDFSESDLNQLIEDAFQLLGPSLSKNIAVVLSFQRPLPLVLANQTQMRQVITNLALNASEAIGERDGTLTLRTRSGTFGVAELQRLFQDGGLDAGEWVVFEMEDTGYGMNEEVKARIFEPFYTTKFTGQGLGLAAVMGVVRSHGGAISVASQAGIGSLFRIGLRVSRAAPPTAPAEPETPANLRTGGTILVVDDDPAVQEVSARLLGALGFEVILADDGVNGLARFKEHAPSLRCVLLDLTMPRMDGFAAHAEMHRHAPEVPVILISGYSQKLVNLPPEAIHPAAVLAKPFGLKHLKERLQAVLGTPN